MAAKSKRARKTRTAGEFDVARLRHALAVPKGSGVSLTSWTLAEIFAARDDQLRGHFLRPARMAESMRTDDAIAVAFEGRLAPQRCIKVEIVPAPKARGASIGLEAEALFGQGGVGISPDTIGSIHACLVNHDVAFASCTAVPRDDGSRVDFSINAWPIEHVRWDSMDRVFKTRVDFGTSPPPGDMSVGGEIPIVHGDGRWIIFQRFEIDPFKHATILAAALVWARRAYAVRDWAKGSVAHGSAKVIGSLPEGVALQSGDGTLTAEATAMAESLRAVATSDNAVVLKPAGSTIEFMVNPSMAWQVWERLVANAESSAAKLYLGTDGTLGSKGGAPGVDVQAMFGVAATRVESDLACITRGLQTGLIEPWTALNWGTSELAPTRRYMIPDADEDASRASVGVRRSAFYEDVDAAKRNGFDVTQKWIDSVAKEYGVEAPVLVTKSAESATQSSDAPPVQAPALRRV